MDPCERIRDLLHKAGDSVNRGDKADVSASLREALPLLEAQRVPDVDPQSAVYMLQGSLMSLFAGDRPLALDYAVALVAEVTAKLRSFEGKYAASGDRSALQLSNFYARVFLPFLPGHPYIDRSWKEFATMGSSSDDAAALTTVATRVRPQLDAAGWAGWPFPPDLTREAHFWCARAVLDFGRALFESRSTGQDLQDAHRLAVICRDLVKDDHDARAKLLTSDALNLIGRALLTYGDARTLQDEAIDCFEQSWKIQEQFGNASDAAVDRANLAANYVERNKFLECDAESAECRAESAEADLAEGLAGPESKEKQKLAERKRAEAKAIREKIEEFSGRAEGLLLEAWEVQSKTPENGHGLGVLINLGALYSLRKDREKAARTYRQACDEAERRQLTETSAFLIAKAHLGKILAEQGNLAEAERLLKETIDTLAKPDSPRLDPEITVMVYGDYGNVLRRLKRADEAYQSFSVAIARLETYRHTFLGERQGIVLLKSYRWVFEAMIDCCVTLGETNPGRWAEAFGLAETMKWRMFTTLLRFLPMQVRGVAANPWQDEEQTLLAFVRDALIGKANPAAGDERIETAFRRLQEIWTGLETVDPDYVAIRRQETAEADEVARLLDDDVPVLVEYYLGEEIDGLAVAFIVRKGRDEVQAIRLPGKPAEIRKEAARLRRQNDEKPVERFQDSARKLYEVLIRPILPFVPEDAGVCFVPIGNLHNIPFNALFDGERYLVERNPVVIAPTANALRWWVRKNPGKARRCLIFTATWDITLDQVSAIDLADFKVLAERKIAPLFPETKLVKPRDSTKAVLLHELAADVRGGPWDVVHIACHGTFGHESRSNAAGSVGLDARLLMASNPNDPNDPNKDLSALDIFVSVRPAAALVTLCACDSAIVATSTNDEMAGLAHGFLFGGAASVVASLWYVVQGVGVEITREFYMNWLGDGTGRRPMSKIDALRQAQRSAMVEKSWFGWVEKPSHPYLWSSFQLLGDWR